MMLTKARHGASHLIVPELRKLRQEDAKFKTSLVATKSLGADVHL